MRDGERETERERERAEARIDVHLSAVFRYNMPLLHACMIY